MPYQLEISKTEIEKKENNSFNLNKNNIIKAIHKSPKITKRKIMENNFKINRNIHKKVLSSNEQFEYLNLDNNSTKSKSKKAKIYKTLKTFVNQEKNDKNKINENMFNKRKNFVFKKEYDIVADNIDKSNKNTPVSAMHYSYNDIHLENKDKIKKF